MANPAPQSDELRRKTMSRTARSPAVAEDRRPQSRRTGFRQFTGPCRVCSRLKQNGWSSRAIFRSSSSGPTAARATSTCSISSRRPRPRYRGPFRPIRTNVPGIEITERLPRLAKLADKFAIVRSLHHERDEHSGGTHRFLTGYASKAANLNDAEYPELGSVVAKQLAGRGHGGVPLFVANTKFYGGGPAYLGPAYGPFMPNPNPLSSTGDNTYDPIPIYRTRRHARQPVPHLRRRAHARSPLRPAPHARPIAAQARRKRRRSPPSIRFSSRRCRCSLASRTRRGVRYFAARTSGPANATATRTGARACSPAGGCRGRRPLRAVPGGVSAAARRPAAPATGTTTPSTRDIFKAYEDKLPVLDQSISALIEDLYAARPRQHVLFIFCGEFGRTPQNRNIRTPAAARAAITGRGR